MYDESTTVDILCKFTIIQYRVTKHILQAFGDYQLYSFSHFGPNITVRIFVLLLNIEDKKSNKHNCGKFLQT